MVLIEVMRDGRRVRYCGARCHNASRAGMADSRCVCGGWLRGITEIGIRPEDVSPALLHVIRENVELQPGEYVQLRIGA